MLISALLGILIGAVLGLTGAGGSIMAMPALMFAMGWNMQQATPVALIAVACGAAVGAMEGFRQRLVRWRGALLMAGTGMAVTPLGIQLAHMLPQRWLLFIFTAVLLSVAARMLHKDATDHHVLHHGAGSINPKTGRFNWSWPTVFLLGAIGALTGFMTGLLGVGGGFVMVPLLRRHTDVSMHGIVATSLLVITLVSSAGVVSALAQGMSIPLQIAILFAGALVLGMLAARKIAAHLPAHIVQRIFAILLIIVAIGMLTKAMLIA